MDNYSRMSGSVPAAYRHCNTLAQQHYENFPVASWLLPPSLREPIAAIYAFARQADDYADEGDLDTVTRINKLDECDHLLQALAADNIPDDPVYIALHDTIRRFELPLDLFHDLVSAFRQDVTTHRYNSFVDVLDYCRRSANPIGRLLLHLAGVASEQNCRLSDKVCSALQLINFYQDISQDYRENDRIYLALDEMQAAGIGAQHIAQQTSDPAMRAFMQQQYRRAGQMLCEGMPLTKHLGLRLGLEIRATIHGGLRIVEHLMQAENVFARPRLRKSDWLLIIARTLIPGRACSQFDS
ncbi:MAG: squalene synthase HpnC [Granulosicoccaceae bacterium]|jgi:squalene synthase HpnC